MSSYPVLRSGFVGMSMVGLKQPTATVSPVVTSILDKRRMEPNINFFYHDGIDELYCNLMANNRDGYLNDLDVQEAWLKTANEALACPNFMDWIYFQFENANITSTHGQFLLETMEFIAGNPRPNTLHNWIRLLDADKVQGDIISTNSRYYNGIKNLVQMNLLPNPARISDIFLQWIRRENGWYDFVFSMVIIFSNRLILNKVP